MRIKFSHPVILFIICLCFTFKGCGGGGGSSDNRDGKEPDPYTGLTTPAQVDENNAVDIAAGSFAAGAFGTVVTGLEASPDDQRTAALPIDNFRTLMVPRILGDAARSVDLRPHLHPLSLRAEDTQTIKGTEFGPCGGSFSYKLEVDDDNGKFKGTFEFSDYCDHGVTISGVTDVKGKADLDSGEIITITFSFDNLSDGTVTMDGKISLDFSVAPIICTLNVYLTDEAAEKVYWASNYSLNIDEYPGRIEIEMFGRFYHPDYGYVDVSTDGVFIIYDGDDWPSSGILLMVGANDTRAKLTAIDETTCRVEADTDGDGVYDWDSGPLLWSDL